MDAKGLLKAGFKKETFYLLIKTDSYSGKKTYTVIDDLEAAKEFKMNESIQQVTTFRRDKI